MNKILIGLLIVGAGAAAFFYFRKNDPKPGTSGQGNKDVVGIWIPQVDSTDDLTRNQSIEFTHEGKLIHRQDTVYDTTYYSWTKEGDLAITRSKEDTVKKNFHVIRLSNDSLQLQVEDSTVILFRRFKAID